jgi:hypothetical protein
MFDDLTNAILTTYRQRDELGEFKHSITLDRRVILTRIPRVPLATPGQKRLTHVGHVVVPVSASEREMLHIDDEITIVPDDAPERVYLVDLALAQIFGTDSDHVELTVRDPDQLTGASSPREWV